MKGEIIMAKCYVCDKGPSFGNKVSITRSHVSNRAKKVRKPNLRKVKIVENGTVKRVKVCTRCLRSNLVKRG